MDYDLTWWLATPFGVSLAGNPPTSDNYTMIHDLAALELGQVKCHCPGIYPTALAIKIRLIYDQFNIDTVTGASSVSSAGPSSGKVALVKKDKVGDTEREYAIVDDQNSVSAAEDTPAGILKKIIATCKAPLAVGASVIRSLPTHLDCSPCHPGQLPVGLSPDKGGS